MCGIAGAAWTVVGEPLPKAALDVMVERLQHRGPDGAGTYFSGPLDSPFPGALVGAALGHRRLSIIDLPGGAQPLANEDQSVWVVFNGEIYNYRTLRRRLQGSGHVFRTASDTEVLVHLYEDEGPDMLRRLEGMFAIALWDARRRRLLLARDRLGKKPLVYRLESGRLSFASELKSLLEVPGAPRELDPSALDEYLTYQYVPHPNTILRGYQKLPPAHYALFGDGELALRCYWRPDFTVERSPDPREARRELRAALEAAVEKRLVSDVPLGAFLSGGVDSTIVVGLMAGLMREPVQTFSIGFDVPEYDETAHARTVAQRFGTQHHEFRVEPRALEVLPRLIDHYDEPFADSSAIPTWYVAQYSRQFVTVALTGDGGDELFAGYPRYRAAAWGAKLDRLPRGVRKLLAARVWQSLPASPRQKSPLRQLKRFLGAVGQSPQARYLDWVSIFNFERRAELYEQSFVAQLPPSDPGEFLAAAFRRSAGRDAVSAASLTDLLTYLPCDLLTKVDIASMAHGLECRQPFLDHEVVELAASWPASFKLGPRHGKRILRQACADLIPPGIARRRKMGFGVPLDHWFRGELRGLLNDTLLGDRALGRGYFQPQAVRQLVDDHLAGRFDHSYRLWSLLVFELWQRRWLDSSATSV